MFFLIYICSKIEFSFFAINDYVFIVAFTVPCLPHIINFRFHK